MKTSSTTLLLSACMLMLAACNSEAEGGPGDAVAEAASQKPSPAGAQLAGEGSNDIVLANVSGSQALTSEHSNLLALSSEEAAWLDRNGYPTPDELDALMSYDIDQLTNALRERKDIKAAALLGHRKMAEGNLNAAWSAFSVGADLGSLYARQQMAIVTAHQMTGLPIENLAEADPGNLGVLISELEVTRLLGDHRAQDLIDKYSANFDWGLQGKDVLDKVAMHMDHYGRNARSTGRSVKGPDPRPNAAEWEQAQQNPDALVTLYTRGSFYP